MIINIIFKYLLTDTDFRTKGKNRYLLLNIKVYRFLNYKINVF
jgi:hypothetical protein